jgi:putative ABC transport system permease protein
MSPWTLVFHGLRHFWRTHLGVLLGTAVASMVLAGSLLVGSSVRATLRKQALERVGRSDSALVGGEQFFREALASEAGGETAPVLVLRSSAGRVDGRGRINGAQLLGVDGRFWALNGGSASGLQAGADPDADSGVALNERAAHQLGVSLGDTVILRVEKPAVFSRDAPLSGEESQMVALRLSVSRVVPDSTGGRFGLQAAQVPPANFFVPLRVLQEKLGMAGRINLLLSAGRTALELEAAVKPHWQLQDSGLELRELPVPGGLEVRTPRVFLRETDQRRMPRGVDTLTYLVNEISAGDRSTPYSLVTAVDAAGSGFLPAELADDEIAVNGWLAEDLGVKSGDTVALRYFVMGERRQLEEKTREFKVLAVVPMDDPNLNGSWMADFPGLSDQKNCRDWKPGFDMDVTRFRDKDEVYWAEKRGTPKAFVNIMVGQAMWGNRWGDLTAVRYPAGTDKSALEASIRSGIAPETAGARFVGLREQALAATRAPVDFGELFVSFSFFLILAATVLTGLLFVFSVEQRQAEVGILLALGWRTGAVRRLFLMEGSCVALLGAFAGGCAAVGYTWGVLRALETVWRGAVGTVRFVFEWDWLALGGGMTASLAVAVCAMLWAGRSLFRQQALALLSGSASADAKAVPPRRPVSWGAVGVCGIAAMVVAVAAPGPAGFFGAGALLLAASLFGCRIWLRRDGGVDGSGAGGLRSLAGMARRNAGRRAGRSLAAVTVLASGIFMVVAVDSFRQRPLEFGRRRDTGTGGFALVGEASAPVYEDLNSERGREALGLDGVLPEGTAVVPLRVRDGDDASCLNLNRALEPRILGVRPSDLAGRGAFVVRAEGGSGWGVLEGREPDGAVRALVDEGTLKWALQKAVGDLIRLGDGTAVRVVGTVKGSLLQGNLVISEQAFVERFPGNGGYRYFLVDCVEGQEDRVCGELSRALEDRGLEVVRAARRLADFQAVENTYLQIFQVLGGLGMILASVGLAVVVARNILERRAEFSLLWALGFRHWTLRRLVLLEHVWLLGMGVGAGAGSALLAVWPSFWERGAGVPGVGLAVLVLGMCVAGGGWVWGAVWVGLRGVDGRGLRGE